MLYSFDENKKIYKKKLSNVKDTLWKSNIQKLCYRNLISHIKGQIVYVYVEINNKLLYF